MKNFNSFFNQLTAMPKRLAMVLTVLFTLGVGSVWGATDVSEFTSKAFAGLSNKWEKTSSGTLGYEDARGVQHQKNATTTFTATGFSNVTKVQVWVARSNNGKGSVTIQENSTSKKTISSFNTSSTEQSYSWATPYTGTLKIVVTATASSIYIKKIVVTTEDAVSYTVTYDSNGGSGTMSSSTGSSVTIAECSFTAPSGKEFDEWNTAANGSGTSYQAGAIVNKSLNLYAIWKELPKYTVTLNAGPGSCAESVTEISAGAGVTLPEPTLDCGDWKFAGWATSPVEEEITEAPKFITDKPYKPSGNITLYAVYQRTEDGGGSVEETSAQTLQYDTWSYSGSTTNKTSYRLFHSNSYVESAEFDLSTLSKVVVYGGTFGGDSYNKLTIAGVVGGTTTTWKSVTVSGNSQTGVNTYTGGTSLSGTGKLRVTSNSGSSSSSGVRISKIMIYTLQATSTTYYYSYPQCTTEATVTLDLNGGSFDPKPDGWEEDGNNYTKTVNSGDQVTLPEPNKTGHDFEGWYNASTKVTSPYTLTGNTTLTAHWTPQDYTITYKDQGNADFTGTMR